MPEDILDRLDDMEKVFSKTQKKKDNKASKGSSDEAFDILGTLKLAQQEGIGKKSKSSTFYLDSRTLDYLDDIKDNVPDIKSRSQALSFLVAWHKGLDKQLRETDTRLKAMDQKLELMSYRTEKLGAQSNKLAMLQNSLSQTSLDATKIFKEVAGLVKALSRVKKLNKEDVILQEIKELKETVSNMQFVTSASSGAAAPKLKIDFKGGSTKTKASDHDIDVADDLLAMF